MKTYEGRIWYRSPESNQLSGYCFGSESLEKTKQMMADGIAFYKPMAKIFQECVIEASCDKCHNEGVYKIRRPRSVKTVKCECNKQYINERYEYIVSQELCHV